MIALAFGTVAEFQLRVVSVRAAADLALVAVASLRLRLLLLPDGGLELNSLSGPLAALDPQMLLISSQKKITKFKIATTAARALA